MSKTSSFGVVCAVLLWVGCIETDYTQWYKRCHADACAAKCSADDRHTYCLGHPDDPNCSKCGGDSGASDGAVADASGIPGDSGLLDGGADACTKSTWYEDADSDGDGDPAVSKMACSKPDGYVDNADDADPGCGRPEPSAHCLLDSMRCTVGTAGDRETCVEDTMFPGCTDWKASVKCAASAPVCSGPGACGKCTQDSQCAGFGQVCNTVIGSCVQCTPATEVAQCPDPNPSDALKAPACDPQANTCTGQPRESVSGCGACKNDSECTPGTKCVATNFNGVPHGSYCLLIAPDSPTVCPNQYAAKRTANSVLGVNDEYCFPNDTFTTCEAVLDVGEACGGSDEACGAPVLTDGLCRSDVCTYGCDKARDCSGSTDIVNKCVGAPGAKYCDPN